jgi:predicted nucleic acid-binding protein
MASSTPRLLYLDASALVKLIQAEAETEPLMGQLGHWSEHVTSVVGETELHRAARRTGVVSEADVDEVLERVALLAFDDSVRQLARQVGSPGLRTLDAVHLASALSLGDDLGGFCCYDKRLAEDAETAGLTVIAPV